MKRCYNCGNTKEIHLFYRNRAKKDGYRDDCKDCYNAYMKKWNKENPDKHSQYNTIWRDKNKEKQLELTKLWQHKNIERHRANKRKSQANLMI